MLLTVVPITTGPAPSEVVMVPKLDALTGLTKLANTVLPL